MQISWLHGSSKARCWRMTCREREQTEQGRAAHGWIRGCLRMQGSTSVGLGPCFHLVTMVMWIGVWVAMGMSSSSVSLEQHSK